MSKSKDIEPTSASEVIPDAYTMAYGFKKFDFVRARSHYNIKSRASKQPYDRLFSPYTAELWWPRSNAHAGNLHGPAKCSPPYNMAIRLNTTHKTPHPECMCGYYAHYTYVGAQKKENVGRVVIAPSIKRASVCAVVFGGGHIEAHEAVADGFRAEYMEIAALIHPGQGLVKALRRLAYAMGIPYFISVGEAEKYARERAVDMWPLVKEQMELARLDKIIEGK